MFNKINIIKTLTIILLNYCIIYSCFNAHSKRIDNETETTLQNNNTKNFTEVKHKTVDIPVKYLLGKFNPENDSLFVEVPLKYCLIRKEYLHKDVLNHFIEMYEAAIKEGISLKIISAHRTFSVQKWLWEQKIYSSNNNIDVVKNILQYSAMPGTSRHHWGTDIDIISTQLAYFETIEGKKAYNWLLKNASKYGFYQVYNTNNNKGYNEEKWHWSYLKIANNFENQYIEKITYKDFHGFYGHKFAEELNIIENYVKIDR
jgi:hypothetical protein